MSSAATTYAFVGRQATFGHEPPQRRCSTSATRAHRDSRCCLAGAVARGRAGAEDDQVVVVGGHLSPVSGVNGGVTVVRWSNSSRRRMRLLVERLRAGDEAAFAAVDPRMYEPVDCCASREMYVSSRAVAEDVVQETWVAVLERHRPLRGPLVAEDVDLPDPREHGEDARRARARGRSVLFALRRRRGEASTRPSSGSRSPAARALGRSCRRRGPEDRLLGDGDPAR